MTFRALNQKWLIPLSQWVMVFGIVALSQPWSEFLHRYGLTLTLLGLVAFIVTVHIAPDEEVDPDDLDDFEFDDSPHESAGNGRTGDRGPV